MIEGEDGGKSRHWLEHIIMAEREII